MAAGVPVVASGIPPHRELLAAVEPGAIVDFDEPEKAAAVIDELLGRSTAELVVLGTRLRDRARHYDVARLLAEIEVLYTELGVRSRRPAT
jgi:glycosyltransferase involved in cell wall biosynthesis